MKNLQRHHALDFYEEICTDWMHSVDADPEMLSHRGSMVLVDVD
jgi:hypothetical protein